MRKRQNPTLGFPSPLICRNCSCSPNNLIDDLCPACWTYFKENRKHRPRYSRRELETNLEFCTGINVELRRMKREYRGDNELIRLAEIAAFAMEQLGKATKERIKEAK